MTLNPSTASGLAACGPQQIGLATSLGASPVHFNEQPAACPDASKIGEVEIETPLLDNALRGYVYVAAQDKNPFKSLLAIYLVAEGSGVVVKQAGKIEPDLQSGSLTAVFGQVPQAPLFRSACSLFGGPRAPLRTPPACGTYATIAALTPWARPDNPISAQSSFQISQGPGDSYTIPLVISGAKGEYGTTLTAAMPKVGNEWGYITGLSQLSQRRLPGPQRDRGRPLPLRPRHLPFRHRRGQLDPSAQLPRTRVSRARTLRSDGFALAFEAAFARL
jgi:hypothetical protein